MTLRLEEQRNEHLPNRLTTLSFPQTFSELGTLDELRLNELIDLEKIEFTPISDEPIEHERYRYYSLVLSKAAKILNREDSSSLATLRLIPEFEGRAKIKNAAGFRVVDIEAIKNGDLDQANRDSLIKVHDFVVTFRDANQNLYKF